MMQITELRIGNWIKYQDKHLQVIEFNSYMICCAPHWGFDNFEEVEGIPLTPEILYKCGFDDWSGDQVYAKLGLSLSKKTNFNLIFAYHIRKEKFEYVNLGGDGDMDLDIKYLHQLQNLYFALTGSELTVNL